MALKFPIKNTWQVGGALHGSIMLTWRLKLGLADDEEYKDLCLLTPFCCVLFCGESPTLEFFTLRRRWTSTQGLATWSQIDWNFHKIMRRSAHSHLSAHFSFPHKHHQLSSFLLYRKQNLSVQTLHSVSLSESFPGEFWTRCWSQQFFYWCPPTLPSQLEEPGHSGPKAKNIHRASTKIPTHLFLHTEWKFFNMISGQFSQCLMWVVKKPPRNACFWENLWNLNAHDNHD